MKFLRFIPRFLRQKVEHRPGLIKILDNVGWLFIDKSENVTLAMSIYAILASGATQPWSQIGSLALIMSLPVVVIFVILQRTLLDQLLLGNTGESS